MHNNTIMRFKWNNDKNELLKKNRNISFEQIILSIEDKKIVDVLEHPNQKKYKGQVYILVEYKNYVYVVPSYISNSGEECHLKTIYPSRKYTDQYLKENRMNEVKFLDNEEQALVESLEKNGWKSTKNLEEWKTLLSKTASDTLAKDQRMNIRVSKNDLDGIKLRAVEEGLPYQTLVTSIIHKYITGRLIEKQS